jgi:hypothetical protein
VSRYQRGKRGAVNQRRRRTEKTMVKKGQQGQTMINKTLHRKLKIEQHEHC